MSAENSTPSRLRRRSGTLLILLTSLLLLGSAAAKLAHLPPVVAQLSASGFDLSKINLVGMLEVLCALLFLVPVTRSAGLLLVSAFLGGAIATHLQHSQSIVPPALVLFVVWLAAWLRHPQILWSALLRRPAPSSAAVNQTHLAQSI